jgi:SAM-dependent methyltransferase
MNPIEPALDRLRSLQVDNLLSKATLDALRPRFNTLRDRHDNGTAPRAVTAYQLFQTPVGLAQKLVALLGLQPGESILEPSAGLGRLLDAMPPGVKVTAVEVAPQLAAELFRQDRPGVTLLQRDFLECSGLGPFDAVAMNPPFHMRSDVRHIRHAFGMLRPGGRLAALCLAGKIREAEFRSEAEHWEEIPAGAFKAEGTGVATVLMLLRK